MGFQVGDKVIHWNYGLGEIVQLDEKVINLNPTCCYVVRIRDLTIWVPVDQASNSGLRSPTPRSEFKKLFEIFHTPGEQLPEDRFERKTQLLTVMKDGKLASICRVIRDLSVYSRVKKLNDNDTTIMQRAQNFLIDEWVFSLSITSAQAQKELGYMLAV